MREEGHPDKTEGWPELRTVTDLRDILTTVAFTGSAHHAAVNFGAHLVTHQCSCYVVETLGSHLMFLSDVASSLLSYLSSGLYHECVGASKSRNQLHVCY